MSMMLLQEKSDNAIEIDACKKKSRHFENEMSGFLVCLGQFLLLVGVVVVAREFCQNLSGPSELVHKK